jgi:hypothetical protein
MPPTGCAAGCFAVREFFEAGGLVPATTEPPAEGSPLFEYLVARLLASFDLPLGIGRYLALMSPLLPDGETWARAHGLEPQSRLGHGAREERLKVQSELDTGHLPPLGLIKVKSASPAIWARTTKCWRTATTSRAPT